MTVKTDTADTLARIMAAPAASRLFVYGTLMSTADGAYGQAARARLAREAPLRLPASTQGRLYELGQYPGLVANGSGDGDAHGQLLVLTDPAQTLAWLDDYEAISSAPGADNEYVRQVVDVAMPGGALVRAWAYVYRKPVAGLQQVVDGRWQAGQRERLAG